MTLSLEQVRQTRFHLARRNGYEPMDVDNFVDKVEVTLQQLGEQRSDLIHLSELQGWLAERVQHESDNPHWRDIAGAVDEFAQAAQVAQVPAQEVLDALYEAAAAERRSGRTDALRLSTAHGAKGLEFDHVIVMDCGDWAWDGDDNRRLLYVAMTRARQTLVPEPAHLGRRLAGLPHAPGADATRLERLVPSNRLEGIGTVLLSDAAGLSGGGPVERATAAVSFVVE